MTLPFGLAALQSQLGDLATLGVLATFGDLATLGDLMTLGDLTALGDLLVFLVDVAPLSAMLNSILWDS